MKSILLFVLFYFQVNVDAFRNHSNINSIPILSVSLNYDPHNYVPRLIRSIDFPVDRLLIQIGNSDKEIVNKIVKSIKEVMHENLHHVTNMEFNIIDYNPGSAKGFNNGLRAMMKSTSTTPEDWALVVNSDIAFYPGVLKRIARSVDRYLISNKKDKYGIGFTSLCCGSEWSAVIFTRKLVKEVGYFDENFYPAYYEDDDYGIRISLSSYKAVKFNNTALLHGEIDGSKDYLSGLFSNLYLKPDKSKATADWRKSHEIGMKVSVKYIESKWGIVVGDFKQKNKLDCKSIEGINKLCKTTFKSPFNSSCLISNWTLSENTLERIINSKIS